MPGTTINLHRSSKLLTCSVMLGFAMPLSAETEDESRRTSVQVTPYVWASGVGGDIAVSPALPTFRVEKSFGELLEDLDAAFFISGAVRHDRLVAIADFSTTSSSRDALVPTGNPALPFVPAEGRLKQTSLTLVGGYRVVEGSGASLDLLAGGRAWWIKPGLDVPALGASVRRSESFVDPIVAARGTFRLAPKWSATVYGDIGGFGAGSDFTGQLVATVNARVGRRLWLSGGYRHLVVDYSKGQSRADIHLAGPLLGATIVF